MCSFFYYTSQNLQSEWPCWLRGRVSSCSPKSSFFHLYFSCSSIPPPDLSFYGISIPAENPIGFRQPNIRKGDSVRADCVWLSGQKIYLPAVICKLASFVFLLTMFFCWSVICQAQMTGPITLLGTVRWLQPTVRWFISHSLITYSLIRESHGSSHFMAYPHTALSGSDLSNSHIPNLCNNKCNREIQRVLWFINITVPLSRDGNILELFNS